MLISQYCCNVKWLYTWGFELRSFKSEIIQKRSQWNDSEDKVPAWRPNVNISNPCKGRKMKLIPQIYICNLHHACLFFLWFLSLLFIPSLVNAPDNFSSPAPIFSIQNSLMWAFSSKAWVTTSLEMTPQYNHKYPLSQVLHWHLLEEFGKKTICPQVFC